MRIEIYIDGSQLSALEVVEAIKRSRLNAADHDPFSSGETGIFRDINGNAIGGWKTVETNKYRKEKRK